jgi:iron complex outermembrane recepter protein
MNGEATNAQLEDLVVRERESRGDGDVRICNRARSTAIEEVVVTAQRRSESVQEGPMTVTPVTAEQITDLKLQRFEDVQQLSPGLALNRTGRASTSSLRGVTFNPDSGAAPSIDTYINEVPLDPQFAFQSIFDVQQIEVLRGSS